MDAHFHGSDNDDTLGLINLNLHNTPGARDGDFTYDGGKGYDALEYNGDIDLVVIYEEYTIDGVEYQYRLTGGQRKVTNNGTAANALANMIVRTTNVEEVKLTTKSDEVDLSAATGDTMKFSGSGGNDSLLGRVILSVGVPFSRALSRVRASALRA